MDAHQYLRLIRRRGATTYSDDELSQLRELLETAPGVKRVKLIELHPKGGYRVTFDRSDDSTEAFILLLEHSDWMAAM